MKDNVTCQRCLRFDLRARSTKVSLPARRVRSWPVHALFAMVLAAFASGSILRAEVVTVPGTANPWLAGAPNGTTAMFNDRAPDQSPVPVNISPGVWVRISATGSVNNDPFPSGLTPNGGSNIFHGAEHGLAGLEAPINSLIGVFRATPGSSSSPGLDEPFFIGAERTVRVPAGAARLFLGSMDGYDWNNNFGAFAVTIEPADFVPIPLGNNLNARLADMNSAYPSGTGTLLGGVPFDIPATGNNVFATELASGGAPGLVSFIVPTDLVGVRRVHFIINTFWGETVPGTFASLTFNYADGTAVTKLLDGDSDVRDWVNNIWANNINNTTTVNVFSTDVDGSAGPNPYRLDKLVVDVSAHQFRRLTSIVLQDFGSSGFQRVFIAGITAELGSAFAVPNVTTLSPTNIENQRATLRARVNPNGAPTDVEFFLNGASVGTRFVGDDSVDHEIALDATGLAPHTSYTVLPVATNPFGSANGAPLEFRTLNTNPVAFDGGVNATTGDPRPVILFFPAIDADGDNVELVSVEHSEHLSIEQHGIEVIVTPAADFVGLALLTFRVTDGFGGFATGRILVNVTDNDAPVLTLNGENPVMVPLDRTYLDAGANAVDAVDGAVAVAVSGDVNTAVLGTYTITYTAFDSALNIATATRTINVVPRESIDTGSGGGVEGEPPGTTFRTFGVPAIDDTGRIAFATTLSTPDGNVSSIVDGNIVVAHVGDAAPDLNGSVDSGIAFAGFKDPGLNNHGRIAFSASLAGATVSAANSGALFTHADGMLQMVVREGNVAPDLPGLTLTTISSFALTDEALYFTGTVAPSTADTDMALWAWTPEEGARLLLRDGATIEEKTVRLFVALHSAPASPGHGRSTVGDAVLARVSYVDGTQSLVKISLDGTAETLAATRLLFPASEFTIKSFGLPILNRAHGFAFLARLTSSLKGQRTAVLADNGAGAEFIFTEGAPAPQLSQFKIGTLNDPVLNEQGDLAVTATLDGGKGPTDAILWKPAQGPAVVVAREGQQAIEMATGVVWKAFTSLALPDNNGPLFVAATTANQTGLWSRDRNGGLHLLAREGQVVGGKVVKKLTVLDNVNGSSDETRSFNANRQVVYRAGFADGSSALVKVDVP
jgi:hypothetical protein